MTKIVEASPSGIPKGKQLVCRKGCAVAVARKEIAHGDLEWTEKLDWLERDLTGHTICPKCGAALVGECGLPFVRDDG